MKTVPVVNVKPTYGKLNSVKLIANQFTEIYKVSANAQFVSVDINAVNTTENPIKLKIAISNKNPPPEEDYIEFNVSLGKADVLERGNMKCSVGEMIIAVADADGIVIRAAGYEKVVT